MNTPRKQELNMNTKRNWFSAIALVVAFALAPLAALAHPAQDLVKQVTGDLITALEDPKSKGNPAFVREALDRNVLPHIDFNVMTIKSVGKKNWIDASDEQRTALVTEFREFLLNVYTKTLDEYSGQKMEFLPFSEGKTDKLAVVKTKLNDGSGGSAIPIDYKLRKKDSWLIYDISVHNSSLVLNYKSEFGSEIKKGGIDGLIKALQKKNSAS
jgi:phospholipid transport system substrate-binding protein